MKASIVLSLSAALVGVLAQENKEFSAWYEPEGNVTCKGYNSDGHVECEDGHLYNAVEPDFTAVESRDVSLLESRQDRHLICNVWRPLCLVACRSRGRCTGRCNRHNVCICSRTRCR